MSSLRLKSVRELSELGNTVFRGEWIGFWNRSIKLKEEVCKASLVTFNTVIYDKYV